MDLEISQIESHAFLSTGEKIEEIEARVVTLRQRAGRPEMQPNDQHDAMLFEAETALKRLKQVYSH